MVALCACCRAPAALFCLCRRQVLHTDPQTGPKPTARIINLQPGACILTDRSIHMFTKDGVPLSSVPGCSRCGGAAGLPGRR